MVNNMNEAERPTQETATQTRPIPKWDVTSVTITDRTITVIFPEKQSTNEVAEPKTATEPSI